MSCTTDWMDVLIIILYRPRKPYARYVIWVGRPRPEFKRRVLIGQSSAPRVQICAFPLFHHWFIFKMAVDDVNV